MGLLPCFERAVGIHDRKLSLSIRLVRAYLTGMPAFSLTGNVTDFGGGRFEVGRGSGIESEVRRRTASHDVTESAEIVRLWSGIKQGLLFAVAYAGMAGQ